MTNNWLTDIPDISLYNSIYETIINDVAFCTLVSLNIILNPLYHRSCREQINDETYCSAVNVFVLSTHKKVLSYSYKDVIVK